MQNNVGGTMLEQQLDYDAADEQYDAMISDLSDEILTWPSTYTDKAVLAAMEALGYSEKDVKEMDEWENPTIVEDLTEVAIEVYLMKERMDYDKGEVDYDKGEWWD